MKDSGSNLASLQRLERSEAIERLEPFDWLRAGYLEQAQSQLVLRFVEDRGAAIAAVNDVVGVATLLSSSNSRHEALLTQHELIFQ